MYKIGQEEIDAVAAVVNSGKVFRYHVGNQCAQFEQRYAERLGVKYCAMTASGTNSLTAALIGLGIGPGDEVLVPACTYMATAIAVLAVGAIPVIVDIDESITMDPAEIERKASDHTRAVIPVHMWGLPCDMDAVTAAARKRNLYVVEDACQAVGGSYKGRMLGSIGDIGAFSFNYFKNMTAGEGGAVVTNDKQRYERMSCAIDPCSFYWNGRDEDFAGFTANGARASEFEGALLNVQLDRIDGMITAMRSEKRKILDATHGTNGIEPIVYHDLDGDCGTHVMYLLPTPETAAVFAEKTGGTVARNTGRHVYTEWDPILQHRGAHHPLLNPFEMEANAGCRTDYTEDMCSRSLEILGRTVFVQTHPDHTDEDTDRLIDSIRTAAAAALDADPATAYGHVGS